MMDFTQDEINYLNQHAWECERYGVDKECGACRDLAKAAKTLNGLKVFALCWGAS